MLLLVALLLVGNTTIQAQNRVISQPGQEARERQQPEQPKNDAFLFGKLLFKPNLNFPAARVWVTLLNSKNERISSLFTDPFGGFFFDNLSDRESYTLQISEGFLPRNVDTLYLANQSGYVLQRALLKGGSISFTVDFVYMQALVGYSSLLFNPILGGLLRDENNQPIEGLRLNPVNHSGRGTIGGRVTSSRGAFNFGPANYFESSGIEFKPTRRRTYPENQKIYLYDFRNNLIDSTVTGKRGAFQFTGLPKMSLRQGLAPIADQTILFRDQFQENFSTTRTNLAGDFRLENLQPQKKYVIAVSSNRSKIEPNSFVYVLDEDDLLQRALVSNGQGMVSFVFSERESAQFSFQTEKRTSMFFVTFIGRILQTEPLGSGLSGATVTIYDSAGQVVGVDRTNGSGSFKFKNLDPFEHYIVEVSTTRDINQTLVLANSSRTFIRRLNRELPNKFVFEFLPSDHIKLSNASFESWGLMDSFW